MDALDQAEVKEFLIRVGIAVADPTLHIGREITYRQAPRRVVVIHFGPADSAAYIARVASVILSAQDTWLLIPRHGPASKLGISSGFPVADALRFGADEREQLCRYLCTRDTDPGAVSADLYVVGGDGRSIVTWDHHTQDAGLRVALRDVSESSKLLERLNDCGVEMEVFYTDG